MERERNESKERRWPRAARLPLPAKVLVTAVILTMGIAMGGAMAQIIVHDIIPTFFSGEQEGGGHAGHSGAEAPPAHIADSAGSVAGDLFGAEMVVEKPAPRPFYKGEQFVWILKWTHIHLFGINMIFIFLGGITLLLDLDERKRAWLVALPFAGILVDIGAMWLKIYVSPVFFWLHIPGGGLFGGVFLFVAARALWEMWGPGRDALQ